MGPETTQKRWDVISPDGFSIHFSDTWETKEAALAAFEKWKENYRRQGYYSSVQFGRIALEELAAYCQLKEVEVDIEMEENY